jgi:hypothetical protein
MEIKTSAIAHGKQAITSQQARRAMLANEPSKPDEPREDIKREVKRLLAKHDITLDTVISKYNELLNAPIAKVTASDILNILKRLEELLGVKREEPPSVDNVVIMLQDKSIGEVKNYLTDITNKTKAYLDKLPR